MEERVNIFIVDIFKVFACLLVLSGNALILMALKKSKSLHKATRLLLANVAVADMLYGVSLGLHSLLRMTSISGGTCASMSLANVSGGSSMSGILLLCVQCFLCIRYLVRFKTGLSKRLAIVLIFTSWILWTGHSIYGYVRFHALGRDGDNLCGIISTKNDYIWMGILAFTGDIHVIVLAILQVSSLVLIQRKKQEFRAQAQRPESSSSTAEPARHLNRLNKFSRLVSIITMVLVMFVLTWGPFLVALSVFVVYREDEKINSHLQENGILPALTVFNSFGNIIIYWKKSEEIRDALSNICRCKQRIGIA